jgi:hypothetical protein
MWKPALRFVDGMVKHLANKSVNRIAEMSANIQRLERPYGPIAQTQP